MSQDSRFARGGEVSHLRMPIVRRRKGARHEYTNWAVRLPHDTNDRPRASRRPPRETFRCWQGLPQNHICVSPSIVLPSANSTRRLAVGISVDAERNALRTRLAQWPVFKTYIDWKRVEEDLRG